MMFLVHYTSYGDICDVAVYAPNADTAVTAAESFLRRSGLDVARIGQWRRDVWAVDDDIRRLWCRVRSQQDHVSLMRSTT